MLERSSLLATVHSLARLPKYPAVSGLALTEALFSMVPALLVKRQETGRQLVAVTKELHREVIGMGGFDSCYSFLDWSSRTKVGLMGGQAKSLLCGVLSAS